MLPYALLHRMFAIGKELLNDSKMKPATGTGKDAATKGKLN